MKLREEDRLYILSAFSKMKSKEDFLGLLNFSKVLIYGQGKTVPFELRHLNFHCNPKLNKERYTQFSLAKKGGGERIIHSPSKGLKSIQKCLNLIFQSIYEPNKAAKGFVPAKSIIDNAQEHIGSNYVYNIDLKDFFPSIDQARVWGRLKHPPFNLNEKTGRLKLNNIIASLCCEEMEVERLDENGKWQKVRRNVLPQGAPTSPTLTNIICQQLDFYLTAVAKRFGLKYTRYADDITFSSLHNVYQSGGDFQTEIQRIIKEQNFHIKEKKTRLQKQGYRQEVTGIVVNEKINVQKRYAKQLRMWIYFWEQYGYDKANRYFLAQYLPDRKHAKTEIPNMANVIGGKLNYLAMVRGNNSALYLKLKKRLEALRKNDETVETPSSPQHVDARQLNVILKERMSAPVHMITPVRKQTGNFPFPIKHNPKELVDLLRNFSINDSPLKYTTHSWDAGRQKGLFQDLPQFLNLASKQYHTFSKELNQLSRRLNAKIFSFLFNADVSLKGWGEHRIKFGWSSPELIKACNLDPELKPEDFILPVDFQQYIDGKTVHKFKHVIDRFKNEIEIRDENSVLLNLIIEKHNTHLTSFNEPSLYNLDNKTFYTDVQLLSEAFDLIFQGIQKRPQHREVQYSVTKTTDNSYTLEILQKNSFNPGRSIYDNKLKLSGGDFGTIKDMLMNLCDWSIESQFAEGNFRINYLVSAPGINPYERIETADGFKHILTFYK